MGVGDIKSRVKVDYENYDVMLQNVYYAPKCRRKLISVAQIEKKEKILEFKRGLARVTNVKTGQKIIEARKLDNLYIVQANVINPANHDEIKLYNINMIDQNLWHRRFCHINSKSTDELKRKRFVRGLN